MSAIILLERHDFLFVMFLVCKKVFIVVYPYVELHARTFVASVVSFVF